MRERVRVVVFPLLSPQYKNLLILECFLAPVNRTLRMPQYNRQLAAILFTDIVGYTALMQQNERNALLMMKRYTRVLINW